MTYHRTFDASSSDSLAKLARWIRPGTTVLELGSAIGYFTEFLAARVRAVDVVEIDAEAAKQAARHARRVIVADLEADAWVEALGDAAYDTIVCADVLEHVRDGAKLLGRLRDRLSPGGELLLSVPNVAHDAIIASLIDERFDYAGEGLLDPTHVRLYTWRSLALLLRDAGFGILEWDATALAAFQTELRVRTEALPASVRQALEARPRGRVYQWLVRAARDAHDRVPEPPVIHAQERVPVRLLYADRAEALALERAVNAWLPPGDPVHLEWPIPTPSAALRVLLADRIGVVRITDCRLMQGNDVLWTLGDQASVRLSRSLVCGDAQTFVLAEPAAWFEPVLSAEIASRADRLVATLAWPAGIAEAGEFGAFTALAGAHVESDAAKMRMRDVALFNERRHADEVAAHRETREWLDGVKSELARAESALAQRNADVDHLEDAVDALKGENARLDAAISAQERLIAYRQSARWWLRLPLLRVRLLWHRWRSA